MSQQLGDPAAALGQTLALWLFRGATESVFNFVESMAPVEDIPASALYPLVHSFLSVSAKKLLFK